MVWMFTCALYVLSVSDCMFCRPQHANSVYDLVVLSILLISLHCINELSVPIHLITLPCLVYQFIQRIIMLNMPVHLIVRECLAYLSSSIFCYVSNSEVIIFYLWVIIFYLWVQDDPFFSLILIVVIFRLDEFLIYMQVRFSDDDRGSQGSRRGIVLLLLWLCIYVATICILFWHYNILRAYALDSFLWHI